MAEIPIPFTGEDVDTSDGAVPILMTLGAVIAGFAVLSMVQSAGNNLYQRANAAFTRFTGIQLDGSSDTGPGGV